MILYESARTLIQIAAALAYKRDVRFHVATPETIRFIIRQQALPGDVLVYFTDHWPEDLRELLRCYATNDAYEHVTNILWRVEPVYHFDGVELHWVEGRYSRKESLRKALTALRN